MACATFGLVRMAIFSAPGDERRRDDRPPVIHEEARHGEQDARLQRNRLAHVADEGGHLRHQVDHEEEGNNNDDPADERRVHGELLGLRGELVFPFERFGEAFQDFRKLAGLLAGTNQADEDFAEDVGVVGEDLRQALAALNGLHQAGDHLAKARVLDAVAQVGQPFHDRHAGARELLKMEAEIDEILPLDAAAGEEPRHVARRRAGDEVELHAREALLEVEQVHGVEAADHRLAARVNRLVGENRRGVSPSTPSDP